ncbi:MAG: methionyl-tRNA formyltransferase [Candidatus Peribacteraceae bacterium]|nr:methionyl-tRNA formyltransferase [Candidatus Peribacteraceae bacterium]MBP9850560.1 methionyl-tRNA formyltransferase [Candidatus Peribacteraceae bacterium]
MSLSKPKSIVFLGTSQFSVPSLQALAADPAFTVELVITQPDRPTGRKQVLTPSAVKIAAETLQLPMLQPEKINTLTTTHYALPTRPDFLVVVSYGQILSQDVLDWPTVAAVNVHASLLPQLRGASPLQHAILQGLPESGVTVQRMVKELDAGPILSRSSMKLDARETSASLHDKLKILGAELLLTTLKSSLTETAQDATKATFCGKLSKADGVAVPATMTAEHIDRMVRALTPWPGVTIGTTKILETSFVPGSLTVECLNGTMLTVERVQPASGKPMSGADFIRGNKKL